MWRRILRKACSANATSVTEESGRAVLRCTLGKPDTSYYLADPSLSEVPFRVVLANGNDPMNVKQINGTLIERWATSAYPRNLSPHIINRLLEGSANYCIVPIEELGEDGEGV